MIMECQWHHVSESIRNCALNALVHQCGVFVILNIYVNWHFRLLTFWISCCDTTTRRGLLRRRLWYVIHIM